MSSRRIERVSAGDRAIEDLIRRMVATSVRGLPAMYQRQRRQFSFTRRGGVLTEPQLKGTSLRYGVIVLLGALHVAADAQRAIFCGEDALEFCGRLLGQVDALNNIGDVALVTWAAGAMGHPRLAQGVQRLRRLLETDRTCFTVELAWALSAWAAAARGQATRSDADQAAARLLAAFDERSGIFPHMLKPARAPWYRATWPASPIRSTRYRLCRATIGASTMPRLWGQRIDVPHRSVAYRGRRDNGGGTTTLGRARSLRDTQSTASTRTRWARWPYWTSRKPAGRTTRRRYAAAFVGWHGLLRWVGH